MVMADLDRMMQDAVKSPEEAQQIASLDHATPYELQPTVVQINAESQPVTIYHTATGEPRVLPRLYARTALLKRFRAKDGVGLAGRFVFSSQPTVPYVLGSVKCLLHPDRPERSLYSSWGLPTCKSEHFPSEFEAEQHTINDHASAWGRIRDMKQRAREDEDRQLQRDLLRGFVIAATPSQRLDAVANPLISNALIMEAYRASCPQCGKEFEKAAETSVKAAVRMHQLNCKGVKQA